MSGDGRTVLVTGANSGIGLASLLELARRGFSAVGTVRSPAKARAVRAAAREAGVEVETMLLDVGDAARCARVVEQVKPYGLVNNAGFSSMGAVEDVDDHGARLALETMVLAPIRLARLCLPHMRAAGGGRIVMVSSIYGRTTTPLTGWYQASKHALEAVSDALRIEVAQDGIRVVLVEPGGFDTGIWEQAQREADRMAGSRYETVYRRTLDGVRLSRPLMGDPAACARVIARAIESRNPGARQLVGRDAQLVAAFDRLPTGIRDRLLRVALGL